MHFLTFVASRIVIKYYTNLYAYLLSTARHVMSNKIRTLISERACRAIHLESNVNAATNLEI